MRAPSRLTAPACWGRWAAARFATHALLLSGLGWWRAGARRDVLTAQALSLAPDGRVRPMVFWLLGGLGGALDSAAAWLSVAVLAACVAASARDARALNLMLRGDLQAFSQGVEVDRVRRRLVIVASIATGWAVALAGAIGFVGFIAPHLARFSVGNDQRLALPASVFVGATLLAAADLAARTVASPTQLPVGVLTVMIGVPVFLWQLRRQ